MKFIEKISDNRFIVEMGPEDADNTRSIVLATEDEVKRNFIKEHFNPNYKNTALYRLCE